MLDSSSATLERAADVNPVPVVLRVLSAVAGLLVFFVALILSFGAAIAAPLGIVLVRRWTIRNNRPATRLASIVGAILASTAAAAALWLVLFATGPRPSDKDLQKAVAEAQNRPSLRLPDWYTRVFPQAARTDSATKELVRSPAFIRVTLLFAFVVMALLFGVVGGTLGWCSSALLRIAWSGRRAA